VHWAVIDMSIHQNQDWLAYSSWCPRVYMAKLQGDSQVQVPLHILEGATDMWGYVCFFSIEFAPHQANQIVVGTSERVHKVIIFDIEKDKTIGSFTTPQSDINAIRNDKNTDALVFSGTHSGLLQVWDKRLIGSDSALIASLTGHAAGITYIDSKNDGHYFLSNSYDNTVKLWDLRKIASTKEPQRKRSLPALRASLSNIFENKDYSVMTYTGHKVDQTLIRARFSPAALTGQNYIYTGSSDPAIYIYDVLTGEMVQKLSDGHYACVRDISWHPYLPYMVSSSWDGTLLGWEHIRPKI